MIPKTITLRSFKCFSGETTFTFPTEPGLYLVQGRNEIQPLLEGNGCGKSTLFGDAITWCLFGKTPRLLKASDILNWEAGSAGSVYFTFEVNKVQYGVLRTQTPNSLCLDTDGIRQTVTQDQINTLLGLDFDSFVASIVFAQFGTMFFDLSATDKSTLLSSILDLDLWDVATDQAKKSVTQLESSLNIVLRKISHAEGQISGLSSRDFTAQIDAWEADHAGEIEKLNLDFEKGVEKLNKIKVAGVSVEKQLEHVNEELEELVDIEQELTKELRKLEKQANSSQQEQTKELLQLKNCKSELTKFKNVVDVCPYCNQKVSETHLKQEIYKLSTETQQHTDILTKVEDAIRKNLKEIELIKDDLALVMKTRAELLAEQRQFLDKKSQLKSDVAKILGAQAQFEQQLQKLQRLANPYVEEMKKQKESIKQLNASLEKLDKEQQEIEKELHGTQYWTKAFREVRLSLISEALIQLELEVNNKLFQLGLQDWKVLFAVEGLTKGGKIKKGFTVTIVTPYNLEPVNWNAWSGGESQRLRLAGALGMADLITSKCPMLPMLEVFDEPTAMLSNKGIESLIEVLKDRAVRFGKIIFLVDHRDLPTMKFEKIYTVVKTSENCVIVEN